MEPLGPLGLALRHAGHNYELWLQRNEWFLYRGEPNGTSFRFFIIIKADRLPGPDKSGEHYWLEKAYPVFQFSPYFSKYHWVLPILRYEHLTELMASLKERVIAPAEKMAIELEKQKIGHT
jgi:hypothetical protein